MATMYDSTAPFSRVKSALFFGVYDTRQDGVVESRIGWPRGERTAISEIKLAVAIPVLRGVDYLRASDICDCRPPHTFTIVAGSILTSLYCPF